MLERHSGRGNCLCFYEVTVKCKYQKLLFPVMKTNDTSSKVVFCLVMVVVNKPTCFFHSNCSHKFNRVKIFTVSVAFVSLKGSGRSTWMRWSALGLRSPWLSATLTVSLWAAATRRTQPSSATFLPWVSRTKWVTQSTMYNKNRFRLCCTARHICLSLSSASDKRGP